MRRIRILNKRSLAFCGLILTIGLSSGVALAATFSFTSGPDVQQQFKTEDAITAVSTAPGWHDVPNTNFTIAVPSGHKQLVHVTFSGESQCQQASWCSLRAVASNTAATSELLPASGTDFAFDAPDDQWASHAMGRVIRLSGGSDGITYTIKIQAQVVGPTSTSLFTLDDYLTQLEVAD